MKRKFFEPYPHLLIFMLLSLTVLVSYGQEMSPLMQEKFMKDQDLYFQRIDLSSNQKQLYEEITRKYDKRLRNVDLSVGLSPGKKKSYRREIRKSRNAEMKRILTSGQFKIYKSRQKEIRTLYDEGS